MISKVLAVLFGCSTLILGAIAGAPMIFKGQPNQNMPEDQTITFGDYYFEGTEDHVHALGTLTADWIAYKNNTYTIHCDSEQCLVASVEQIGHDHVGWISVQSFPVKRWTDRGEVVGEDDGLCERTTLTLDRPSKTVLWVETPINQTSMNCARNDGRIRKATLEKSLTWRRLTKK